MVESAMCSILRQGVWASLTGGWFFDQEATIFRNTLHLYLWLFLILTPFLLHLCVGFVSWWAVGCYTALNVAVFSVAKLLNWRLHRIFDKHQAYTVESAPDGEPGEKEGELEVDAIELTEMGLTSARGLVSGEKEGELEVDAIELTEMGLTSARGLVSGEKEGELEVDAIELTEMGLTSARGLVSGEKEGELEVDAIELTEMGLTSARGLVSGEKEGELEVDAIELTEMGLTSARGLAGASEQEPNDEDDSSTTSEEDGSPDKGESLYLADVHQEPSSSSTGSGASYQLRHVPGYLNIHEHRYETINDGGDTQDQHKPLTTVKSDVTIGTRADRAVLEQITEDELGIVTAPASADFSEIPELKKLEFKKSGSLKKERSPSRRGKEISRELSAPTFSSSRRRGSGEGRSGSPTAEVHRPMPLSRSSFTAGMQDAAKRRELIASIEHEPQEEPYRLGHTYRRPQPDSPRPGYASYSHLYSTPGTGLSASASAGNQLSEDSLRDTLRDIKHRSRKSYPGKSTSSVDLFLNNPNLGLLELRRRRRSSTGDTMEQLPGDSTSKEPEVYLARRGSARTPGEGEASRLPHHRSLPMSPSRGLGLDSHGDRFPIDKIPEKDAEVDGHYEIIKDDESETAGPSRIRKRRLTPHVDAAEFPPSIEHADVRLRPSFSKLGSLRRKLEMGAESYDSPTYEDPDHILQSSNASLLYEDPDQLRSTPSSEQSSVYGLDMLFKSQSENSSDAEEQPIYSQIRKGVSRSRPPSLGIVTTPDIPELPKSFGGAYHVKSASAGSSKSAGASRLSSFNADTRISMYKEEYRKVVDQIVALSQDDAATDMAHVFELLKRAADLNETVRKASQKVVDQDGSPSSPERSRSRKARGSRGLPPLPDAESDRPSTSTAVGPDGYAYPSTVVSSHLPSGPLANFIQAGTHLATSHDDTTDGAIHIFEDGDGRTWYYVFDANEAKPPQLLDKSKLLQASLAQQSLRDVCGSRDLEDAEDSDDSDNYSWANTLRPAHVFNRGGMMTLSFNDESGNWSAMPGTLSRVSARATRSRHSADRSFREFPNPIRLVIDRAQAATNPALIDLPPDLYPSASPNRYGSLQGHHYTTVPDIPPVDGGSGVLAALAALGAGSWTSSSHRVKRKQYYKIHLWPKKYSDKTLRLNLTRLQLEFLLDRNRTIFSCLFDVLMAGLVSILAALVLRVDFYYDIFMLLFCIITGSALFSLLKSVQPDAVSPIHGYNWIVSYSRPGYFVLIAAVVLILSALAANVSVLAALNVLVTGSKTIMLQAMWFLAYFILFCPLIFTIGLLPQLNTFFMHVFEQIEMHVFGGTAAVSFLSSIFAIGRSILSLAILTVMSWAALGSDKGSQSIYMSIYLAFLVAICFWLSRSTTNIGLLWRLAEPCFSWLPYFERKRSTDFYEDLRLLSGGSLTATVKTRFKADLLSGVVLAVLIFAVHTSTLFTVASPHLAQSLGIFLAVFGVLLHYVLPHLRKHHPWLLLSTPLLKLPNYSERHLDTAQTMQDIAWFERLYAWLCFVERNVFYPIFILAAQTQFGRSLYEWGAVDGKGAYHVLGCLILVWSGMRVLRGAYCSSAQLYLPLSAALLIFKFDFAAHSTNLMVNFALLAMIAPKIQELLLKMQFVYVYTAPWQISWGSTFHAFAHPFTVPHSAFLFAQATISSALSAPLNPFLGSVMFIMSYMRPVKFWEKDYNTRRVDNSNTRLINQIDRGPTSDDNNLNSIFYEHLTRSLQTSLAGDVLLGRIITPVSPGDCFILASDYLNCLLHIVEIGNGFVTFQLRGLEFRGTYCQQREVEAIQEDHAKMTGCCCCEPGRLPHCLAFNEAWRLRWCSWEVVHIKYAIQGYNITDNSANSLLQVYELRKLLVDKYLKCILYYAIRSQKLEEWLCMDSIQAALETIRSDGKYVDLDPMFGPQLNDDFDMKLGGVSKSAFVMHYHRWVQYCVNRRDDGQSLECGASSLLMALVFALSLVGRRALIAPAHQGMEPFLRCLHALFKGDYRIQHEKDEWIFADMDFLRCTIAPAIRMALKLHQDHFAQEEYSDDQSLYEAIGRYESSLFISHEGDPAWRTAVLSDVPSLLALRHVYDGSDGSDEFKVIMLNRKTLFFTLIKLNRESVRGLWAGQQQELIFFRNKNNERGSIQNARQVLRNMINSSADQPIGYPIYVSPLVTSFVETNSQVTEVLGPAITLQSIWNGIKRAANHIRYNCGMTCSSNVSVPPQGPPPLPPMPQVSNTPSTGHRGSESLPRTSRSEGRSHDSRGGSLPTAIRMSQLQRQTSSPLQPGSSTTRYPREGFGFSLPPTLEDDPPTPPVLSRSFTHPPRGNHSLLRRMLRVSTDVPRPGREESRSPRVRLSTIAQSIEQSGIPVPQGSLSGIPQRVRVTDATLIFDKLNETVPGPGGQRRYLVQWPGQSMIKRGGRLAWRSFVPAVGTEGDVIHRWTPCNVDMAHRSHIDKTILLLKVNFGTEDFFVPVAEHGVEFIGSEV